MRESIAELLITNHIKGIRFTKKIKNKTKIHHNKMKVYALAILSLLNFTSAIMLESMDFDTD